MRRFSAGKRIHIRQGVSGVRGAAALLLTMMATGCDFEVVNPGPVDDQALDHPSAHAAVVTGMELALLQAINPIAYTGAIIAKELVASGSTQSFGVNISWRNGQLLPNEIGGHWSDAQRARWVAEAGVARFRTVLGDGFATSPYATRALIQVGFANRLLGENFCQAVIDGGGAEPHTVHFERAEAAFTEALAIASTRGDTANATIARAGRASVRVSLGRWSEALQDAQQIPLSFSHSIRFSGSASSSQFNAIYWASANQPYRNHTVWGTWFEGHFSDTEDPRTEWGSDPAVPNGENAAIPWYFQRKFTGVASPLNLVTGREARLIVAEGLLRSDDLPGAVQAINSVREPIGLDPIAPGSLEEAWLALKLERTAEFWLEARRLGDYRRWATDQTPGAWPAGLDLGGRDLCFPIARNEIDSNPNL